jgi:hypothetical protein
MRTGAEGGSARSRARQSAAASVPGVAVGQASGGTALTASPRQAAPRPVVRAGP